MINIYCVGFCIDNGKPTQQAACGIVLKYINGNIQKQRQLAFVLGPTNAFVADLQAIRIALASIRDKFKDESITIYVPNANASRMLIIGEDGLFSIKPTKNYDIIAELRKLYKNYKDIRVIVDSGQNDIHTAKELARTAMSTQKNIDIN